jgi:hypothetical protein
VTDTLVSLSLSHSLSSTTHQNFTPTPSYTLSPPPNPNPQPTNPPPKQGAKLTKTLSGPISEVFTKVLKGLSGAKLTRAGAFRNATGDGPAVRCTYKADDGCVCVLGVCLFGACVWRVRLACVMCVC